MVESHGSIIQFNVEHPGRIDRVLCTLLPDHSRSYLQSLIVNGNVTCNAQKVLKKNLKVLCGDLIKIEFPEPVELELEPLDVGLRVLYEDEEIMAVHKPAGILSHPNHSGQKNTLVNGLLYLGRALSSINGVLRPGIVHRLDRETSGVMLIARTDRAHRALQDAFAKREIKKVYYALSYGRLDQAEGEIQLPLGRHPKKRHLRQVDPKGRDAATRFKVIKSWDRFHFIRLEPLTGRTHQIRVHLKSRGIAILHDLEYAGRPIPKWVQRLQLHAFSIRFTHPINGERIFVRSPLEPDMVDVVCRLNRGEAYVP